MTFQVLSLVFPMNACKIFVPETVRSAVTFGKYFNFQELAFVFPMHACNVFVSETVRSAVTFGLTFQLSSDAVRAPDGSSFYPREKPCGSYMR